MNRRFFLTTIGLASAAAAAARCASRSSAAVTAPSRLRRIGLQLYSLRDDARRDLERTIAEIAAIGYRDIELLGSFNNFGTPPARLRALLDSSGLRAPSTHVSGTALDDLERQLDDAQTLGHEYVIVASLPAAPGGERTVDHYRRWADRLNDAGRRARARNVWIGFHNHASDHAPIAGVVPYDVLVEHTDPALVRHQLDTGNTAMAGRDPLEYIAKYGARYWLFHIKDVPRLGATADTELGSGVIDFPELLARIDDIDQKFLFVEQETYPGAPLDSVRRDYAYMAGLTY